MSWLRFNRSLGRIELYSGSAPNHCAFLYPDKRAEWVAHNEAATSSNGAWPAGVYRWSHYNAHAEAGLMPACHSSAYGCYGIHVFAVSGRPGIGVHAGRTWGQPDVLGGKTLGCIRVPANAIGQINRIHADDRLEAIIVF